MMLENFHPVPWPESHKRAERRHYIEFLVPVCAKMLVCPPTGSIGSLVVPAHARRYLFERLKGRVANILGSAAGGYITMAAAMTLIEHVRTPWWKRMWWLP